MARRPNDLSVDAFQQKCLDGCARILGAEFRFERVHGSSQDYWHGLRQGLDVFIYEDGAEIGLDGKVHVYEWPDFKGLTQLADKFLGELDQMIRSRA